MKTFKQFIQENDVPANAMGDGSKVAGFDPLLNKKPLKRKKPFN